MNISAFDLMDELREDDHGTPILSPSKFIRIMHLDITSFAKNARVHRNTVSRAPAALSVQSHIRDNVRVLRAAWEVAGQDLGKAIYWYRNEPLAPFSYKTAETLVADGRADDVIRLIESYGAGAAG
jgi:hypothetical protein